MNDDLMETDLTIEVAQKMIDEAGYSYKITRVDGTTQHGIAWYNLGQLGERSIIIADKEITGMQG